MSTVFYVKLYAAMMAAFLVIDGLWLGLIARGFYRRHLGFLMAPKPNWAAALIFYALFLVGVLVFVVLPGLRAGSAGAVVWRAVLFGLVTYATYDLTNLATVRDWPLIVTVVDMAWGAVVTTVVALVGFYVGALDRGK